jgi:hypothetical protein
LFIFVTHQQVEMKKLFKVFGISHVVIAVVCMLIGVVVEFHQVHIYKNNISFWHLQATKTVNEKSKKQILPISYFIKQLHSDLNSIETGFCEELVHFHRSENTMYSRQFFDLMTHEYSLENILRGPPVA